MKLWRDLEEGEEVKAGDRAAVFDCEDVVWVTVDQKLLKQFGTHQCEYWIVQREVKL